MTEGTSQGLFVVVAIVIFGIFIGLSYTVFGSKGGLTTNISSIFTTEIESVQYKINTAGNYNPLKDSDVVFIQDDNLIRIIKDNLAISSETELTLGDIKNLKVINGNIGEKYNYQGRDNGVKSLKGLEYAINLEELWLHGNAVESLEPIKDLRKLKVLNVNGNESLTDLSPLKNITSLERLMVEKNLITTIEPLRNLTNLTMINIGQNDVSDLTPITNLTKINELHIFKTNIEDISFLANFDRLTYLNAHNTLIKDFSYVSGVKKLIIK